MCDAVAGHRCASDATTPGVELASPASAQERKTKGTSRVDSNMFASCFPNATPACTQLRKKTQFRHDAPWLVTHAFETPGVELASPGHVFARMLVICVETPGVESGARGM